MIYNSFLILSLLMVCRAEKMIVDGDTTIVFRTITTHITITTLPTSEPSPAVLPYAILPTETRVPSPSPSPSSSFSSSTAISSSSAFSSSKSKSSHVKSSSKKSSHSSKSVKSSSKRVLSSSKHPRSKVVSVHTWSPIIFNDSTVTTTLVQTSTSCSSTSETPSTTSEYQPHAKGVTVSEMVATTTSVDAAPTFELEQTMIPSNNVSALPTVTDTIAPNAAQKCLSPNLLKLALVIFGAAALI